jgi:predicted ABC-type ATPase
LTNSKELLVVAGPNGAGKTTFALEYAERHNVPFLSADAMAEPMLPESAVGARVQSGRRFLAALSDRLSGAESFLIETTLSGNGFRRTLLTAGQSGFSTSLVFVYLDSPETCLARIAERVRKGGHPVPEEDVRRRFWRSLQNF